MTIRGCCDCRNIEVAWHTVDYSLVPRACQCEYCIGKSAAYVSKSASRVGVVIHDHRLHAEVRHGSRSAVFHECGNCGCLVFVTAEIDGELYGALNARHLVNRAGFSPPVKLDFSDQDAEEKKARWRQNWCHPVKIVSRAR